jgi:hypothetical protein
MLLWWTKLRQAKEAKLFAQSGLILSGQHTALPAILSYRSTVAPSIDCRVTFIIFRNYSRLHASELQNIIVKLIKIISAFRNTQIFITVPSRPVAAPYPKPSV